MKQMNVVTILTTFLFCSMNTFTTISNFPRLNTNRVAIHQYDTYWILSLPCISETSTCSMQFLKWPYGWTRKASQMKIPFTSMRQTFTYEIIATVEDDYFPNQQFSILITEKGKLIEVKAKYDVYGGEEFDVAVLNLQRQQSQSLPSFQPKDEHELTWMEKNGIVHSIPTLRRLDLIIASSDTFEITRTFQNIISDKSPCEEKIDYLNQVTAHVTQHIQQSKDALLIQQQKIQNAQESSGRLEQEYALMEKELEQSAKLSRQTLRQQERALQREKVVYYSKYYSISIVANKYLQKLNSYIASSAVNDTELQEIKDQILADEKELKQINKQIYRLLEEKSLLERKIENNQKKVSDTGSIGYVPSEKVKSLEKKYKDYNDLAIQYEAKSKEVQEKLTKIKAQASKAREETKYLQDKMKKIEKQMKDNKKIIEQKEDEKLQQTIKVLESHESKLEESAQICTTEMEQKKQDIQKVKETLDKQIIFTSNPPQIPELAIVSHLPPKSFFYHLKGILQKVNIFSSEWIIQYGVPSASRFSCESNYKTVKGYGMIVAVDRKQIRVQGQDGRMSALYLGSCSTVKGMRKTFVPIPGDIIDWEGEKIVTGIINLHQADIYRI